MKRLLTGLFLASLSFAPALAANVNIDALPAASSAAGADLLECEQSGINRKCTVDQVKTYANTSAVRATTTTSEALANSDQNKLVTFSNASAVACTIAQAGSGGNFAAGWAVSLKNLGVGTVTCTPTTSTVDGAATVTLTTGQGLDLYSDGTNYFTQPGKGGGPLSPWLQPGYLSGKYYLPYAGSATTGSAIGAGNIRLIPFMVSQAVTISELSTRVTTASGGGNFQLAVYAANTSTLRPTGNALATTASISTTSATALTSALSGNVALSPNVVYWAAINCDNGTAAFLVLSSSNVFASAMIGSATLTNVLVSGTQFFGGLSVVQTFGTWPDLTAASFTEITNPGTIPAMAFKVL